MIKNKRQKIRKTVLLISFLLFPGIFYYLSPYLIIEGTLENVISGSFVMFGLMFLSSLFLGRAYCGWVCPASDLQDQAALIRDKRVTKGNIIKWLIWFPWIAAIAVLAVKNGGYQKVDFFYRTSYGFSMPDTGALFVYFFVIALVVIPAFAVGRRSFCHHICWMAPFMIAGRSIRNFLKLPALQLASVSETCTHCHSCTKICPMSLPVEDMVASDSMENPECILCGSCADVCRSSSICYSFARVPGSCSSAGSDH